MSTKTSGLFDLTGRVALVTGGGSGLGKSFCEVLAESGAHVVCSDLHWERAEETRKAIEGYGGRAMALKADVAVFDEVRGMFGKIEEAFGGLDILVNNAGVINRGAPIDAMDIKEWHRVIDVNLHGVFYCMREGLRIMAARKKGSIINVASITGLCGIEPEVGHMSPYATSKAAVIGLTRQGAAEYASFGIRVNAMAPGWHLGTRLAADAGIKRTAEEIGAFRQALLSRTPMGRTGDPDELKGMLLYLASDASSFVTGQVMASDGGWTCV